MGYPEFKFTVDISYQDVAAFGPLIVPIIPTPWDSSINLRLEARVYTEAEIKIDLSSIKSVKKVMYSKYILNRSVYNLHLKGTIRFYTRGADAIELIDKDGLIYLIGSQKSEELARVVYQELNKK